MFSPGVVARLVPLRVGVLRPISLAVAAAVGVYLLGGVIGGPRTWAYPWDGLALIAYCGFCAWASGQPWGPGRGALIISWFVAATAQPAFFFSQTYGLSTPWMALLLVSILLCGVLVGGWFLGLWTVLLALWVLASAVSEVTGRWDPLIAVRAWPAALGWMGFWWLLFGLTAWVTWLFTRTFERAALGTQGQASSLVLSSAALAGRDDPAAVLPEILRAITAQLEARYATLYLTDPERRLGAHLAISDQDVVTGPALAAATPTPRPADDFPIFVQLAETRRAFAINDIARDARLVSREAAIAQGIKAALYIPVLSAETVIGMLTINRTEARGFTRDEIGLGQTLSGQLALAVHIDRLARQGQASAVSAERNRMARELHDTLAQGFIGVILQLEAVRDVWETEERPQTADGEPRAQVNDEAKRHVMRALRLARENLGEARRALWALRPALLEARTLAQALGDTVRALTEGRALQVILDVAPHLPRWPAQTEGELLRIVQEAVTNVVKHAQAHTLTVRAQPSANGLQLIIHDDGVGFDPALVSATPDSGFGLLGLRERAARIGADLLVESTPGQGTRLQVTVTHAAAGG